MTIKTRLQNLEKIEDKQKPKRPPIVLIDWGDDKFNDGDKIMTRSELDAAYPDGNFLIIVYEWSDDPNHHGDNGPARWPDDV